MKKNKYSFVIILCGLVIIGLIAGFLIQENSSTKTGNTLILNEVPFEIEPFNPVPETRHWNGNGRSFYYFNWGIQNSGGYSLQFDGLHGSTIRIKALRPNPDEMAIQVITYPKLLLSLPRGNYDYQVVDEHNRPLNDIFKSKNPPLKFTIFLTEGNRIRERIILRDPYLNNEGKTTALIALEGLFNQVEMFDFLEHEVTVENVTFSRQQKSWSIIMSPSYADLDEEHRSVLAELITKTVLAIKAKGLEKVQIETAKIPQN